MVKEEVYQEKPLFVCESCGFGYLTQDLAERCEEYCIKQKSCSLEITKQAVKTA